MLRMRRAISRPALAAGTLASTLLCAALCGAAAEGGARPSPEEVRAWVARLGDPDFQARSEAKERLLALSEKDAEGVLRELPAKAEDPDLRDLCASIRAEVERRRVLRPFGEGTGLAEAVLRFREDPTVQVAEDLASQAYGDAELRKAASDLFLRALDGDRAQAWAPAAVGLAKLKEKDAVPRVLKVVRQAKAGPDRLVMGAVLMELADASSAPDLAELLKEDDPMLRILLAQAVANLDARRFAGRVAALLDDPHPEVRRSAAGALGRFAGEEWPQDPEPLIAQAKAWWEAHRGDPAFAPER